MKNSNIVWIKIKEGRQEKQKPKIFVKFLILLLLPNFMPKVFISSSPL